MGRIPCKVLCARGRGARHSGVRHGVRQDDHGRVGCAGVLPRRADPRHGPHPRSARADRPGVAEGRSQRADGRGVLAGEGRRPGAAGRTDHHERDPVGAVGGAWAGGRVRHVRLPRGPRRPGGRVGSAEGPRAAGGRSGRRRAAVRTDDGPVRPRRRRRSPLNHRRSWAAVGGDPRQHPYPGGLPALPHRHPPHPRLTPAAEGQGRPGAGDRHHGVRPGRPVRRVDLRTRTVRGDRTRHPRRIRDRRAGDPRPLPHPGTIRGGAAGPAASRCCRRRSWSTPPRGTCAPL